MSEELVDDVLRTIGSSEAVTVGEPVLTPPMTLHTEVKPPVAWQASEIETALQAKIPEDAGLLWKKASEIRLHEDVNYGQWGCILWSPAEIVNRHAQAFGWRGPDDFRPGDLIIGEFRGDTDLVVLRCDPFKPDFGNVVVALAMDPREEWPTVAPSIVEFIKHFHLHPSKKFWESGS